MRAVLDTNVLVRCTKNATGPARECFRHFETKQHILLISQYLLSELARVLTYPRLMAQHRLSVDEIREFLVALETVAETVQTPLDVLPVIVSADPDDDPIVQLAVSGKANVLCTHDRHLRSPDVQSYCASHGIQVLTDLELLELFRKQAADSAKVAGNQTGMSSVESPPPKTP